MAEDDLPREFVDHSVTTIPLDPVDNDAGFMLGEKSTTGYGIRSSSFVREIDDEEKAHDAEEDGDCAFDSEYPLPPIQTAQASHLGQAIRQNIAEARSEESQEVEGRETLLHFIPDVPATCDSAISLCSDEGQTGFAVIQE